MGVFAEFPWLQRKIYPEFRHITEDLQSHLTQIGVDSEILNSKEESAITHKVPTFGNNPLFSPPLGVIKVKNRNMDFIELKVRRRNWGETTAHYVHCIYAVHGNIKNEDKYWASNQGGDIWFGDRLAEVLNADNELKTMLNDMDNPPIIVMGIKSDAYVAIYKDAVGTRSRTTRLPTFGIGDYPSLDELKMYDRIAGHVKELITLSW